VSLGVASFSQVGGVHFQNQHDIETYQAALREGHLPLYRALTMRPQERVIRELILQFKLGRVSREYFQSKFDVDIVERFAEPLAALRQAGLASIDSRQVVLTREALLQVDRLLYAFFLPEHRTARYA
jgi:oxygen-independent coproporphyrinogen III oxidase